MDSGDESICIIIYLFYEDKVDKYIPYIEEIPTTMNVCIVSSKESILELVKKKLSRTDKVLYRIKENRGRDISAFLVACKDLFFEYEYVCFLHDKKEKHDRYKSFLAKWEESIWDNLILNEYMCKNILFVLKNHSEIGLLVPPEPMSDIKTFGGGSDWKKNNKENTEQVLKKVLGKEIVIDDSKRSLATGTVFWARTNALTKLLSFHWRYIDFPPEPLADDGTISHAIERSLPYFAADAGYTTRVIMSAGYVENELQRKDDFLSELMELNRREFGIYNLSFLRCFDRKKEEIETFCKGKNIYIYGAGERGEDAFSFLKYVVRIEPNGFIDRNKAGEKKHGLEIKALQEVKDEKNVGIIVSVGVLLMEEVKQILTVNGIHDFVLFSDSDINN